MKIRGREYQLTARRATDVLDIQEGVKRGMVDKIPETDLLILCLVDSLSFEGCNIGFFRGLKYWRFKYFPKHSRKYLRRWLSISDVYSAFNELSGIEETLKKKVQAEMQSEEK